MIRAVIFDLDGTLVDSFADIREGIAHALQGIDVVLFFDQAEDIMGSLRGLLQSGFIGSFFAVAVLMVVTMTLSDVINNNATAISAKRERRSGPVVGRLAIHRVHTAECPAANDKRAAIG